jgi:hypothetical protein
MDWSIDRHAVHWGRLFEFHSIKHDLDSHPAPENVPNGYTWIFVPASLTINEVNALFKRTILLHNVAPFTAPGIYNHVKYELSDRIAHNDRDTSYGSYSHVVKTHFLINTAGRLESRGHPDERMTVMEAMLYHTLYIHLYGNEYFDVTSGGHHCGGSRGGLTGKARSIPYLRWDMSDNKVCLDW